MPLKNSRNLEKTTTLAAVNEAYSMPQVVSRMIRAPEHPSKNGSFSSERSSKLNFVNTKKRKKANDFTVNEGNVYADQFEL